MERPRTPRIHSYRSCQSLICSCILKARCADPICKVDCNFNGQSFWPEHKTCLNVFCLWTAPPPPFPSRTAGSKMVISLAESIGRLGEKWISIERTRWTAETKEARHSGPVSTEWRNDGRQQTRGHWCMPFVDTNDDSGAQRCNSWQLPILVQVTTVLI
jgi:hypothetical protein